MFTGPDTNRPAVRNERGDNDGDRRGRGDGDRRPRFGRPPWMSEAEFKTMIEKQGVHRRLLSVPIMSSAVWITFEFIS